MREVESRAYAVGFAPGGLERELANRVARYIVLEETEAEAARATIVGFGGLWLQFDQAHVITCAVDPVRRRAGYGSLVVHALVLIAIEEGMVDATLEVRASNAAARALYKRYGFYEVGERRKYYADNGEDAVIMTTEALASEPYQARLATLAERLEARLPGAMGAIAAVSPPRP